MSFHVVNSKKGYIPITRYSSGKIYTNPQSWFKPGTTCNCYCIYRGLGLIFVILFLKSTNNSFSRDKYSSTEPNLVSLFFSSNIFADLRASNKTGQRFFLCSLTASVGYTPPYSACWFTCEISESPSILTLANIKGFFSVLSDSAMQYLHKKRCFY